MASDLDYERPVSQKTVPELGGSDPSFRRHGAQGKRPSDSALRGLAVLS
jgi:hypothetical protein